jgi:hypothetical protein
MGNFENRNILNLTGWFTSFINSCDEVLIVPRYKLTFFLLKVRGILGLNTICIINCIKNVKTKKFGSALTCNEDSSARNYLGEFLSLFLRSTTLNQCVKKPCNLHGLTHLTKNNIKV